LAPASILETRFHPIITLTPESSRLFTINLEKQQTRQMTIWCAPSGNSMLRSAVIESAD
jgi:hypothetical protein